MSLLNYFRKQDSDEPEGSLDDIQVPKKFVSWNVNGLISRIQNKSDWEGFSTWLVDEEPDVVCLQEVKLSAQGPRDSVKGDGRRRDRGVLRDNTKVSVDDLKVVNSALNLAPFNKYQRYWSLSDWRYSGVLVLVRKPIRVQQARFNLLATKTNNIPLSEHHVDGRVICLKFENIEFLGTYSPNHGWESEHWKRRDQWDSECISFLQNRKEDIPLLWMGDLNVAPTNMDLSHPPWFRSQVARIDNKPVSDTPPERVGQPGCADKERWGFNQFLEHGKLFDAYREIHAEGPPVAVTDKEGNIVIYDCENNCFSWRGTAGIKDPRDGRFYAKGMRIDHSLLSLEARDLLESADIVGFGADRKNFWGSDHSPIVVKLRTREKRKLGEADESVSKKR